jgi:serine/threonine protein kinase
LFLLLDQVVFSFSKFRFTGTPDENIWPGVTLLTDFKTTFPKWAPQSLQQWKDKFPKLERCGIDLLQRLLAVDPKQRVSARAALSHPYFHNLDEVEARRLSAKLAIQLDFNDGEERRRRRHALRL